MLKVGQLPAETLALLPFAPSRCLAQRFSQLATLAVEPQYRCGDPVTLEFQALQFCGQLLRCADVLTGWCGVFVRVAGVERGAA